jgi:hypothetical protein
VRLYHASRHSLEIQCSACASANLTANHGITILHGAQDAATGNVLHRKTNGFREEHDEHFRIMQQLRDT